MDYKEYLDLIESFNAIELGLGVDSGSIEPSKANWAKNNLELTKKFIAESNLGSQRINPSGINHIINSIDYVISKLAVNMVPRHNSFGRDFGIPEPVRMRLPLAVRKSMRVNDIVSKYESFVAYLERTGNSYYDFISIAERIKQRKETVSEVLEFEYKLLRKGIHKDIAKPSDMFIILIGYAPREWPPFTFENATKQLRRAVGIPVIKYDPKNDENHIDISA